MVICIKCLCRLNLFWPTNVVFFVCNFANVNVDVELVFCTCMFGGGFRRHLCLGLAVLIMAFRYGLSICMAFATIRSVVQTVDGVNDC